MARQPIGSALLGHTSPFTIVIRHPGTPRICAPGSHLRPVLIRDWSRPMDGIAATIWASQTTLPLGPDDRLSLATS